MRGATSAFAATAITPQWSSTPCRSKLGSTRAGLKPRAACRPLALRPLTATIVALLESDGRFLVLLGPLVVPQLRRLPKTAGRAHAPLLVVRAPPAPPARHVCRLLPLALRRSPLSHARHPLLAACRPTSFTWRCRSRCRRG